MYPYDINHMNRQYILIKSFTFLFYRISVVFRVRSAQRIKISDSDLIKRLFIIVLLFAVYLSVRMVVGRPHVVKGEFLYFNKVSKECFAVRILYTIYVFFQHRPCKIPNEAFFLAERK